MREVLLEQVEPLVKDLSLRDKLALVKKLSGMLEMEIETEERKRSRRIWYGRCAELGTSPSAEEIDETRREM
jgi:hypothetical protein